jgi:hypothetical protein
METICGEFCTAENGTREKCDKTGSLFKTFAWKRNANKGAKILVTFKKRELNLYETTTEVWNRTKLSLWRQATHIWVVPHS